MSDQNLHYMGTVIELNDNNIFKSEIGRFILAENHDDEYVFQLICISGYKSGHISGYIKTDALMAKEGKVAVRKEHLIKEINRNFEGVNWGTFRIISPNL